MLFRSRFELQEGLLSGKPSGLNPHDAGLYRLPKPKPYGEYKADELEKISWLFCYKFAPAGTFGFERAEVTKGGVDTDALDTNCGHNGTRGLYFIGEVLNVTGMLGGYNLHFAFACAANLAKRLNARRACLADY